jgi:hypothetical protein
LVLALAATEHAGAAMRWVPAAGHPIFELADLGKSPLAVEAVRRIDEIFAGARSTVLPPSYNAAYPRSPKRPELEKPFLFPSPTFRSPERA